MNLLMNTFNTIGGVFLIILVGFIGVKIGLLDKHTTEELSAYMVYIAVPCTIIAKLIGLESAGEAILGVGLSSAAQVVAVLLGFGLALLTGTPKGVRGVAAASSGVSNSGFIGLPIVAMLFGEAAGSISVYCIIANNLVFWTLGAYFIVQDAKARGTYIQQIKPTPIERLKRINVPITVFVLMLGIVALKIPLPGFLTTAVNLVDKTTAPSALLFCGVVLGRIGFKNIRWRRGFSAIMVGRYVIAPLAMMGIFMLFPQGDFLQKVFIVQAAMPVVTLVELGANKYGGDVEYASTAFVFSLLVFIVTLPITYMLVMA